MILRYVDAKILPGYAAVEKKKIFGYSFFVYEGSKGVIGDLFVGNGRNGESGNGVESRTTELRTEDQLLTHVIETLQQSPGIHRVEAQLLVHDAGKVAQPFVAQGFRRHPRLFMVLPLRGGDAPARDLSSRSPVPEGIEIRKWAEGDFQAAAAIITA